MIRIFDILFSFFGILFLIPIFILIIIIGYFDTKSPIFIQTRVGKDRIGFNLIKFRSMHVNAPSVATHLAKASLITPFGHFLRKSKLDELPQLWSVIKGDLSLVGPRPLLPEYLPRYSSRQRLRHNSMPGITGWAQVNGRNALSWEEKFKLDVEYVEKVSFTLDLKILWMTFLNVVQRKGISADGHATMEEFKGTVRE